MRRKVTNDALDLMRVSRHMSNSTFNCEPCSGWSVRTSCLLTTLFDCMRRSEWKSSRCRYQLAARGLCCEYATVVRHVAFLSIYNVILPRDA